MPTAPAVIDTAGQIIENGEKDTGRHGVNTKALHKIGYGLYVVTSKKDGRFNGQIANTLFQVTSQPPTVAVSINRTNLTWEFIKESRVFAASVVCEKAPMAFLGRFGFRTGREIDKFDGINARIGETGAPIVLDYAVAYLEARVTHEMDVGTHTIFVGAVVNADVVSDEVCMTYDFYQQVKGGKTPRSAASYIEDAEERRGRS